MSLFSVPVYFVKDPARSAAREALIAQGRALLIPASWAKGDAYTIAPAALFDGRIRPDDDGEVMVQHQSGAWAFVSADCLSLTRPQEPAPSGRVEAVEEEQTITVRKIVLRLTEEEARIVMLAIWAHSPEAYGLADEISDAVASA